MDQFQFFEFGMVTRDQDTVSKHMNSVHNIKVELCTYTSRDMEELKNHLIIEHKKYQHNKKVEKIEAEFTCDERT